MYKYFKHQAFGFQIPPNDPLSVIGNTTKNDFGLSPNTIFANPRRNCKRIAVASERPDVVEAAKLYVEHTMLSDNLFL